MSREAPQFKLRMDAELKERVEKAAHDNHRSINAEIVARLEESFSAKPDTAALESRIAGMELRAMATELSLSAAVLQLLQQLPKQDGELGGDVRSFSQEMLSRISAYGDIQARFDELLRKLPGKDAPDSVASFEYRPAATPSAKKPIRKTSRPLGMEQDEWEARCAAGRESQDK